jgi:RNA polymerase sigma-70 factor (ECF subfamily)
MKTPNPIQTDPTPSFAYENGTVDLASSRERGNGTGFYMMKESYALPESDAPDDLDLMRRLTSGDDLALNELMSRWQTPLAGFIQRYTGNQEDALDLTQETFVRVYESRNRYQPEGRFSTWLFTIAANLSRNHARWRERHPVIPLDESLDEGGASVGSLIAAAGDSPSDSAERNEMLGAVRDHVQKLPQDLRAVVLLFEYQELDYEEIAAALGCTRKAVEARLYRARQLLRKSLTRLKVN